MDTFSTLRLRATKLSSGDLPDLVQLHLDEDVSRFLGGVRTPDVTVTYLETNLRHWAEQGVGLWTVRAETGNFVGRAGLRCIEIDGRPELEIAYAFARDAWGRGYATEIAGALVEFWRSRRTEPSLVGVVMKGNGFSERVLMKSGFSYERDTVFHGHTCGVFRTLR